MLNPHLHTRVWFITLSVCGSVTTSRKQPVVKDVSEPVWPPGGNLYNCNIFCLKIYIKKQSNVHLSIRGQNTKFLVDGYIYIYICKLKNNKFDPAYPHSTTVVLKYKYSSTFKKIAYSQRLKGGMSTIYQVNSSDRKKLLYCK